MTNHLKYILLPLAVSVLFSCSENRDDIAEEVEGSRFLGEISVDMASRPVLMVAGDNADEENDPYQGEAIFDVEFIPDESILFVSQRTRFQYPFTSTNKTYSYVYFRNQYAGWEEGFNFKPYDAGDYDPDLEPNPNALDWDVVSSKGSVGNGFALYAMYYPDQQNNRLSVYNDQSTLGALRNSDIMGAYHSTSALYSRVRFMLYHLMVYFKINLYVPVYDETFKTESGTSTSQGFSGFTAASLIDAAIKNVCPDFSIDWSASISSETSPVVNISENYKDLLTDIRMYSHAHYNDDYVLVDETKGDEDLSRRSRDGEEEGEEEGDGNEEEDPTEDVEGAIRPLKKTRIEISQFLPSDILSIQPLDPAEDGKIYDDVFMYSFSVIVPAQYADFTTQNPGFLKFVFERPGTLTEKNYYFSSGFSSNSNTSVLEPNKGSLQVLNLYLPRKGDEVILVGAEIQNWNYVETDTNLTEREEDASSVSD